MCQGPLWVITVPQKRRESRNQTRRISQRTALPGFCSHLTCSIGKDRLVLITLTYVTSLNRQTRRRRDWTAATFYFYLQLWKIVIRSIHGKSRLVQKVPANSHHGNKKYLRLLSVEREEYFYILNVPYTTLNTHVMWIEIWPFFCFFLRKQLYKVNNLQCRTVKQNVSFVWMQFSVTQWSIVGMWSWMTLC